MSHLHHNICYCRHCVFLHRIILYHYMPMSIISLTYYLTSTSHFISINIYLSYFNLDHSLCSVKPFLIVSLTILCGSFASMLSFSCKHFLRPPSYVSFHQHLPLKSLHNTYKNSFLLSPMHPP